jgi:hypothetical protein
MIAQAGAVPRPAALYLSQRRPAGPAASLPRQLIARIAARHRNVAFPLTLAASALAGALVTSAVMDGQESGRESRQESRQDSGQVARPQTFALASASSETVVYRQAPAPQSSEEQSEHPYSEQVEASDNLDDDSVQSSFPRAVQTVRFVNPEAHPGIGSVAAAARESIQRAVVKVEGLVGLAPKDVDAPRKQSIMDQVDDYLWEVYRRIPTKKDGTGDFTWKDPAAAKHAHLGLKDYVIVGMDPEFREQLYHAGRAMDAAGLQWSMLSAFRDDYRQNLASGFKASVGNSLHGGSRRTGGYGHGRAIDITGPEGKESEVWHWIDAHGAKYGLHRPLPGADPAHIQQRGDTHKIVIALRESRTRSAAGDKPKVAKAAVAAAR